MWILMLTIYAGVGNNINRSHITAEFTTKKNCIDGASIHINDFKETLGILEGSPKFVVTCVKQ